VNPLRGLLLAGSENAWLRDQAQRRRFVRRAVSRFMPGEDLEDALAASSALAASGLPVILTHLGENVTEVSEARAVLDHYLVVLDRLSRRELDVEISVKLTQLGLDLGAGVARDHVLQIVDAAAGRGVRIWIDMEGSATTQRTLDLFHEVRARHANVGVAIQAYLRRTPADVDALVAAGSTVRLVKGAYREPASIALESKREVDAAFLSLARRMLAPDARERGVRLVAGTHDPAMIQGVLDHAVASGAGREHYEIAMLYGIRRDEQLRLARSGQPVRVLISYGASWFPWYMRRLAERPANMLFVLRSLGSG
jgi:proline dehydrogenase